MSAEDTEIPETQPYTDLQSARDDARLLSRPKTEAYMVKKIAARLKNTDADFIQPVLKNILENFDNLITEAYDPVFDVIDHIIKQSADISKIIPPLSLLVGNRNQDIRLKATAFLCSIGPLAKMAEDMAMGCLRNNAEDIRLCGAKILFSIGAACSRSITRQLRAVAQRYKDDREFCALLIGTVKRINGSAIPSLNNNDTPTPSQSSLRLRKIISSFSNQSLLLAEDNDVLRDTIQEMLQTKLGMRIHTACNGKEALEKLSELIVSEDLPDYIILDLKMPEINGVNVLSKIRNNTVTKEIPVIVITAVADQRIIETIESMGISSYLKKPFRINDLIKAMASTLASMEVNGTIGS